MIEFYGSLSDNCISISSKIQNIKNGLVFMMGTLFSIIISIILLIFNISSYTYFLGLSALLVVINICLFVVPAKSIVYKLPRKISITKDFIVLEIDYLGKNIKAKSNKLARINKIIDYGECYFITFKNNFTEHIICQKDLIVKGTLEDFENLFKEKIVRKIKH